MNRAEIEELLVVLWSDLLAVRAGPDDNFFDLGGYSLLVVDVVAGLRERGVTVSVDHVFDNPVLSELAGVLADGTAAEPEALAGAEQLWRTHGSPWDPKAPRCAVGLVEEGEGEPLFIVHWGNGNVRFVAEYAASWSAGRPVYGFEAAGYRGDVRPLVSIVDMADRYLAELREIQPHGPYHLAGLCQGALVAFEMARRLSADGESVDALILINPPSQVPMVDRGWGMDELLRFRLAAVRDRFGVAGPSDVPAALRTMVPIAWYDDDITPADFHRLQVLWTAGMFAQDHYELRPYQGPVLIFEMTSEQDAMRVHWQQAAPQAQLHWFDSTETLPIIRDHAVAARISAVLGGTAEGAHDAEH